MKKYSIKELETLAVELHDKYWMVERDIKILLRPPDEDVLRHIKTAPSLEDILQERQRRLNRAFKFTPKTIAGLLKINDLLADCLIKARHEARPLMLEMEKRIKNKDKFLKDYELDVRIQPFTDKAGFYEVLEGVTHDSSAYLSKSKGCLEAFYNIIPESSAWK